MQTYLFNPSSSTARCLLLAVRIRRELQGFQTVTECRLGLLLVEVECRAHVLVTEEFLSGCVVPVGQADDCGCCSTSSRVESLPSDAFFLQRRTDESGDNIFQVLWVAPFIREDPTNSRFAF